jgi:hypothetical protein
MAEHEALHQGFDAQAHFVQLRYEHWVQQAQTVVAVGFGCHARATTKRLLGIEKRAGGG